MDLNFYNLCISFHISAHFESNLIQEDYVTDNEADDHPIPYQDDSKDEPYDYSQDWSDYDAWGYDGVRKKRKDEKVKQTTNPTKRMYEQRHRRRLGSMK